ISADLLVLNAVKAMLLEQGVERERARGLGFAARQHRIEERLNHSAQLGTGAAGSAEFVQFGPAQARKRVALQAQQRWNGERIILGRQEGQAALEQLGDG